MMRSLVFAALLTASAVVSADAEAAGSEHTPWTQDDRPQGVWMLNPGTGTIYWCKQVTGAPICVEAKVVTDKDWLALYQTPGGEASGSSKAKR